MFQKTNESQHSAVYVSVITCVRSVRLRQSADTQQRRRLTPLAGGLVNYAMWHCRPRFNQSLLQHAKTLAKCFVKCFSVKHLQSIFRGGYTQNKTLKHFCKCFANVLLQGVSVAVSPSCTSYRRKAVRPSVCLSVCPSHAGTE